MPDRCYYPTGQPEPLEVIDQAVEFVLGKLDRNYRHNGFVQIIGVTRKTAARDLNGLVGLGVFDLLGSKRGAHYVLGKKK